MVGIVLLGTACTPSGPKALLQGEELIRKGNYEAAIEKLELATNLLPNEARAWNYLGIARHRAGQYTDARLAYERALKLDRDLAAARFNLGKMYMDQGVPISALEQLSTYVMLDQKSIEGWLLMGDANLELLRYDQALENYYAALRLDRNLPQAYNGVGLIHMQRNNPKDAYRFFVEALKHDANHAPAILNLAIVLQTKFEAKELALSKYREYLAKAPKGTDLAAVQAAAKKLNDEINPPLENVEQPVQIAALDTNLTRVSEQPTNSEPTPPAVALEPPVGNVKADPIKDSVAPTGTKTADSVTVAQQEEPEKPETTPPAKVKTESPKVSDPRASSAMQTNALAKTETPKKETPKPPVIREKQPEVPPTKPPAKPTVESTAEPKTEPVVEPKVDPVVEKPVEAPKTSVAGTEEPVAPLEVVQLEVEDIEPEPDIPVAQETPDDPVVSPQTTAGPTAQPVLTQPESVSAEPEKKRGFFQRINPANLFRDGEEGKPVRTDEIVTPLPPSSSGNSTSGSESTLSTQPRQVASAGEYSNVTPMATGRGPRRYSYSRSGAPVPGDRAASERLFQRGLDAQAKLDPGRAASYFASAAMADPSYFPAQYNLGLLSYQTGQTMKSLSAFETALALDPTSAEARYNFALALQKSKYPLDAVSELDTLLENYPSDLRAHLLLGNIYAQDLNNIERARAQYQTVLELDSEHRQAPAIRAWMKENP